jgi:hypothetical protein
VDPQLREGNVISAPFADVAIATIDPADIAAVAAKAVTTDELQALGRSCQATSSRTA